MSETTSTQAVYVIAEAGVNHNGDMDLARRLIDVAASSGADAVKFQSFKPEKVVSAEAPKADYQLATTERTESQFDMLKRLALSAEDHTVLKNHCAQAGIAFMSTPFDEEGATFLKDLGVDCLKLPSGEVTNHPLLRHVASLGLPMILSTGMADLDEVGEAVSVIRDTADVPLTLLHCVTNYPAEPADTNLRAMQTMREKFGVPVGFSDHSQGIAIPIAAVALGATVIEKHFTLDKSMEGPDHAASLEPDELKAMIDGIRVAGLALGNGVKEPSEAERSNRSIVRRSMHAARAIAAGTRIEKTDLIALRPATGVAPSAMNRLVGKVARHDIPKGAVVYEDMVQ